MKTIALACLAVLLPAADFPRAEIANGEIRAQICLPDAKKGYYRGTRFDWSGVVYSLQYKGHDYFGPWFDRMDPAVRDFVYEGAEIVAGPCSAITGPADEFAPLGWDEAKPGGAFIKIGVGALQKAGDGKYDNFRLYQIVDGGRWTTRRSRHAVEFVQELSSSGYGYTYRKTVRLASGRPEMAIEHSLKNTGARVIETSVYNHNFLVLDRQATGPDFRIEIPFRIETRRPPAADLAEIRGNRIVYLKALKDRDVVAIPIQGFRAVPEDSEIRIENNRLGAGVKISADRPLLRESLWSIRTVIAMEPFVAIRVEPGREFSWKSTYSYYTFPTDTKR